MSSRKVVAICLLFVGVGFGLGAAYSMFFGSTWGIVAGVVLLVGGIIGVVFGD